MDGHKIGQLLTDEDWLRLSQLKNNETVVNLLREAV